MSAALLAVGGYITIALVLMVTIARTTGDELETAWMIAWPLTLPVVLVGRFSEWLCDR